jgi:hypothetical protein
MSWRSLLKFNEKFGTNEEKLETALTLLNETNEEFRRIILRNDDVLDEVKSEIMPSMLDLHKAIKYVESVHLDLKYGKNN